LKKGDETMKKVLVTLLIVGMVLPMASLPVYAEVPTEVEGTFIYEYECDIPEVLGGNVFLHCTDTETWMEDEAGTALAGEATTEYWVIIHRSGVATFSSKGVFEGSVLGSEWGVAQFQVTGILQAGATEWKGTWRMGRGTGGLENAHARGTWHGAGPFVYDGLVHFDP
jgi:hypothetical protein